MKRTVTYTGVLEYDPTDDKRDAEWVLDSALQHGDKHAEYFLFHTGEVTVVDDHSGTPGQ